jgi:hypothetical protein
MAASGSNTRPGTHPATNAHGHSSSGTVPGYPPSSTATSSTLPAAYREHGSSGSGGGTPTAAASSLAGPGDELLAINNLLGFIKTRKLAGVARTPVSRRSSSGSMASAQGSQAGGSSAGGGGAAAGGTAGQGRRVWIQPSGEWQSSPVGAFWHEVAMRFAVLLVGSLGLMLRCCKETWNCQYTYISRCQLQLQTCMHRAGQTCYFGQSWGSNVA